MEWENAVGVASSDLLIARLMGFVSDNQETMDQQIAKFCDKYMDEFHGFRADQDDEKSHRVHELFTEYELLFERTLQDFLESEQMTGEAFYAHCRRLQRHHHQQEEKDEVDGGAISNLQLILSALDFDSFCELMEKHAIATQRALKEAEDMGF